MTFIPAVTVPIALIGTLAAMWAVGLLDQHPDAARPRAGDRPGGRRRDRGHREHLAPARAGPRPARRGGDRHAPGVLRGSRHHRHARRGVHPDLVPAGRRRLAVLRVRLRAGLRGGAVGRRRADAGADARLAPDRRQQGAPQATTPIGRAVVGARRGGGAPVRAPARRRAGGADGRRASPRCSSPARPRARLPARCPRSWPRRRIAASCRSTSARRRARPSTTPKARSARSSRRRCRSSRAARRSTCSPCRAAAAAAAPCS